MCLNHRGTWRGPIVPITLTGTVRALCGGGGRLVADATHPLRFVSHGASAVYVTPDGRVEFATAANIPFSASNRFITFSVDVGAENCFAAHPLLQFSLINAGGAATPVGSQIDGCASPTIVSAPAIGLAGARSDIHAGTYTSNGALLFSGSSIGVQMVNNQPSGGGNDHAFDNIEILDVTPHWTSRSAQQA